MRKTYVTALLICLAVVGWLASGLSSDTRPEGLNSHAGLTNHNDTTTSVRARYFDAEQHQMAVSLRGRTEANRQVYVKAQTSGRVIELPATKGSRVTKGDLLCKISMEDRLERLSQADAAVSRAKLEYDGALRLKKQGYQSQVAIASSKANMETAKAQLKRIQLEVKHTDIRAPFDGWVETLPVNIGDLLERSAVCASVLDKDPMLVVAQVAESNVNKLKLGTMASVVLRTGELYSGGVRFIGHDADSVTRTYRVEVEISNADVNLRSGVTADISIPFQQVQAHRLPSSVLALADDGSLQVRVLTTDHKVKTMPVQLLQQGKEGVWVAGLEPRSLVITVGQDFVTTGQVVAPVIDSAK